MIKKKDIEKLNNFQVHFHNFYIKKKKKNLHTHTQ